MIQREAVAKGLAAMVLVTLTAAVPGRGEKNPARTVWDGVYTADQAERGTGAYNAHCATCHGEDMRGAGGSPAVIGPEFMFNWRGKDVGALLRYLKETMPPDQAGSLSDQRQVDIIAAMFRANRFPAAQKTELPPDPKALAEVRITDSPDSKSSR